MQTIPEEFSAHADTLRSTQRSFVKITPKSIEYPTLPWQSKFGGLAYVPKGEVYPSDPDGNPLYFLAQINFAEVPHLAPFPQVGLLQFYISDDGLYGKRFTKPFDPLKQFDEQTLPLGFRVMYFGQVSTDVVDWQSVEMPEPEFRPIRGECELDFQLAQEYVPESDISFSKIFDDNFLEGESSHHSSLWDVYCEAINARGSKLGGYADFCQDDPRRLIPDEANEWLLLFQMDDADGEGFNVMWGSGGVGNFFIRHDALQRLDFSRVLYNWDC